MTTPNNPEYDPAYEQVPPTEDQPATDGRQRASGQPSPDATHADPAANSGEEVLGATGQAQDDELEKDPSDWVSGDDPATEAQKSYIDSLAKQAGEQIPANLTKAQASEQIDRLKKLTGN